MQEEATFGAGIYVLRSIQNSYYLSKNNQKQVTCFFFFMCKKKNTISTMTRQEISA